FQAEAGIRDFHVTGVQTCALPIFLFFLAVPVFTFWASPLAAYMSRRDEFEADRYAAQQSSPAWLVSALVKLYDDNAATLTPDPRSEERRVGQECRGRGARGPQTRT